MFFPLGRRPVIFRQRSGVGEGPACLKETRPSRPFSFYFVFLWSFGYAVRLLFGVLRRFLGCSQRFSNRFYAIFCTNMQTQANVEALAVAVLHGSCALSSPLSSLFLAFGGRSVAILSFPWGRSERRFTLSFSLNCFQLK